jgi:hypothetical protein
MPKYRVTLTGTSVAVSGGQERIALEAALKLSFESEKTSHVYYLHPSDKNTYMPLTEGLSLQQCCRMYNEGEDKVTGTGYLMGCIENILKGKNFGIMSLHQQELSQGTFVIRFASLNGSRNQNFLLCHHSIDISSSLDATFTVHWKYRIVSTNMFEQPEWPGTLSTDLKIQVNFQKDGRVSKKPIVFVFSHQSCIENKWFLPSDDSSDRPPPATTSKGRACEHLPDSVNASEDESASEGASTNPSRNATPEGGWDDPPIDGDENGALQPSSSSSSSLRSQNDSAGAPKGSAANKKKSGKARLHTGSNPDESARKRSRLQDQEQTPQWCENRHGETDKITLFDYGKTLLSKTPHCYGKVVGKKEGGFFVVVFTNGAVDWLPKKEVDRMANDFSQMEKASGSDANEPPANQADLHLLDFLVAQWKLEHRKINTGHKKEDDFLQGWKV